MFQNNKSGRTYRVVDDDNVIVYQGQNRIDAYNVINGLEFPSLAYVECRYVDTCGHYGHSRWEWELSAPDFQYEVETRELDNV